MMQTREELRRELQRKTDKLIEEILDWHEANEIPSMNDIEKEILKIRKALGEEVAELLIREQATTRPEKAPDCPHCTQKMVYKGQKRRAMDSLLGYVELERAYYYCSTCKTGHFPLDHQLGLWDKHWSPELSKQLVWLSGVSPSFEKAAEIGERIGQLSVSDSSIWRQVEKWGEQLAAVEKAEQERGTSDITREERQQMKQPTAAGMGVAMDGAAIYIRDEGWKELKVGTTFDIELSPTKNRESGAWETKAHAINNQYVAHLGEPEGIGKMTWAMARKRGWYNTVKKEVLGDGAAWIWKQAVYRFADSRHILDWYHGAEHLGTAARLLYPRNETQRNAWYEQQKNALFSGKAKQVAEDLIVAATKKPWSMVDTILTEALYFDNNEERMQYQKMQSDGYLIGSGVVESGCKQYKARFCGTGMRWSRDGAERLMPIRSAVMSNSFDSAWKSAYHSPPN